jgi:exodeoxyribonuclease V alpha subunit
MVKSSKKKEEEAAKPVVSVRSAKECHDHVEVLDSCGEVAIIPVDKLMYKAKDMALTDHYYKKIRVVFEGCYLVRDMGEVMCVTPPASSDSDNAQRYIKDVTDMMLGMLTIGAFGEFDSATDDFVGMLGEADAAAAGKRSVLCDWMDHMNRKFGFANGAEDPETSNKPLTLIYKIMTALKWYYEKMEIYNYLSRDLRQSKDLSLTPKETRSVLKACTSYAELRENPYKVFHDNKSQGKVRFEVIDKLALVYKIPVNIRAVENIRHRLRHIMETEGHVCFPKEDLVLNTFNSTKHIHTDFTKDILRRSMDESCASDKNKPLFMSYTSREDSREYVYLPYVYHQEAATAEQLAAFVADKRPLFESLKEESVAEVISELETDKKLNPKQKKIILDIFLRENIYIITGFPGSGKSAVSLYIKEICSTLGAKLLMCAPTGKAANRLGPEAMTVHRALECYVNDDNHLFFKKDKDNPLDYDVVIVDEVSMLDSHMAYSLIRACNPQRTKLVFVGDRQQLPSVSYGCVLGSMLRSGAVPYTELTKIYRQGNGSSICKLAKMISGGALTRSILNDYEDIVWYNLKDANKKLEVVQQLFEKYKGASIQFLAPGKRGFVGTVQLNWMVHGLIFGGKADANACESQVCVNDRVVCIKNLYARNSESEIDIAKSAFNGELGKIVDLTFSKTKSKTGLPPPVSTCTIQFDGPGNNNKVLALDRDNIDLAYCLTVHKSQGSEYDVVILVLDEGSEFLLNRELFYTGVTRAKQKLYIVGSDYCVLKAAGTPSPPRYSNLGGLIKDFLGRE